MPTGLDEIESPLSKMSLYLLRPQSPAQKGLIMAFQTLSEGRPRDLLTNRVCAPHRCSVAGKG